MTQVHTFFYIHLEPTRIHLLQADPRTRELRLLSPRPEDRLALNTSGWHGNHNYNNDGCVQWGAAFHYAGEDASFLRVVNFIPHLHVADQIRTWWGLHTRRRWCYIVSLGIQSDTVVDTYIAMPPPPPPPRHQPSEIMLQAAEMGLVTFDAEGHGRVDGDRIFRMMQQVLMRG